MSAVVPAGLAAGDERRHTPGADPRWTESWSFHFATPDGRLGGHVLVALRPHEGVAWYWACVVGEGRPLLTVVDHEVRPPRAPSLEIRAEGLWADHNVEIPFDHLSLGCEAFALGLDDPAAVIEAHGSRVGPLGDRVPFGLDLEWETEGRGQVLCAGGPGYALPCRVHGEVLVADERIELDAVGGRDHRWGVAADGSAGATWSSGWLDDGTWFASTTGAGPGPGASGAGGRGPTDPDSRGAADERVAGPGEGMDVQGTGVVALPGQPSVEVDVVWRASAVDARGLPMSATVVIGDRPLEAVVVATAPVVVEGGDRGPVVVTRALCRLHYPQTDLGGVGWVTWTSRLRR